MYVYEIGEYTDIKNIKMKIGGQFIINLTNADLREREKIICFFSGLTFFNGTLKKQSKNEFLVVI